MAEKGLQLRERQIIERRPTSEGGFVESFSIRRPGLTNAHELGPVTRISQTVCTGK